MQGTGHSYVKMIYNHFDLFYACRRETSLGKKAACRIMGNPEPLSRLWTRLKALGPGPVAPAGPTQGIFTTGARNHSLSLVHLPMNGGKGVLVLTPSSRTWERAHASAYLYWPTSNWLKGTTSAPFEFFPSSSGAKGIKCFLEIRCVSSKVQECGVRKLLTLTCTVFYFLNFGRNWSFVIFYFV